MGWLQFANSLQKGFWGITNPISQLLPSVLLRNLRNAFVVDCQIATVLLPCIMTKNGHCHKLLYLWVLAEVFAVLEPTICEAWLQIGQSLANENRPFGDGAFIKFWLIRTVRRCSRFEGFGVKHHKSGQVKAWKSGLNPPLSRVAR